MHFYDTSRSRSTTVSALKKKLDCISSSGGEPGSFLLEPRRSHNTAAAAQPPLLAVVAVRLQYAYNYIHKHHLPSTSAPCGDYIDKLKNYLNY